MNKKKKNHLILALMYSAFILLTFGCSKTVDKLEVVDPEPAKEASGPMTHEASSVEIKQVINLEPLYEEVKGLSGREAYDYFMSLTDKGLSNDEILEFFIHLPLSSANEDINKIYKEEEFEKYMATYPKGSPYDGYKWTKGDGTHFKGRYSQLDLKLPFSEYVYLRDGKVGDIEKTYRVGVAIHGFDQPWNVSLADAAQWEADRHPNIEIDVRDAKWNNDKMADIIDSFRLQRVDGILTWPMVESETTIAPVKRAIEAGIPVVSVDRMTGFEATTSRITEIGRASCRERVCMFV